MRFLTSLLPLVLLVTPAALATSPTSSDSTTKELSHAEWLLAKTHRMVTRAKAHHRQHKVQVFSKREKKLEEQIRSLKKQLHSTTRPSHSSIKPSPSSSSTKMIKTTTKKPQPAVTATPIKPSPILAVTTFPSRPSSSPSSIPVSTISVSKKGLGFERIVDRAPLASSSDLAWAYNWNSHLFETNGEKVPSGVQFVPMLWKPDNDHLKTFEKDVEYWKGQPGGVTHILGFNEPDLGGQADMSVQATVDAWAQYMQPFAKQGIKLVSPAVTNGAAPMGLTFLENFMAGVKQRGLKVDAIALHWYDSPTNFDYFKNHLTEAHDKFGLPIWLTEYGFTSGTEQQKIDFHSKMVPWMDSQPWIERYAAFGDFVGTFVDGNGGVLPLGNAYASA
ncbi:hypothetical protein JCM3765_007838 [Sporobolomyces pararoseus]